MKENEHSQNKNHRRAALDRMIEIQSAKDTYKAAKAAYEVELARINNRHDEHSPTQEGEQQ